MIKVMLFYKVVMFGHTVMLSVWLCYELDVVVVVVAVRR